MYISDVTEATEILRDIKPSRYIPHIPFYTSVQRFRAHIPHKSRYFDLLSDFKDKAVNLSRYYRIGAESRPLPAEFIGKEGFFVHKCIKHTNACNSLSREILQVKKLESR